MYANNKYGIFDSYKEAKDSSIRHSIREMIDELDHALKSNLLETFDEYKYEVELIIKKYSEENGIVYRLERVDD